jgi:hypothetical protein
VFQIKPTSNLLVETVVVGSATVDASKDAPQVIAMAAVPVIAINNFCPSTGVPERLVVKDVISTVCAVIKYISTLSVLIVGVALDVVVPVRGGPPGSP